MPISSSRLESLFRPRSIALVGAANKSMFSHLAYANLVEFGFADRTFLVNRRGARASDILGLIHDIKSRVRERNGVDLELEIKVWPSEA